MGYLKRLISEGYPINFRDVHMMTPLHRACSRYELWGEMFTVHYHLQRSEGRGNLVAPKRGSAQHPHREASEDDAPHHSGRGSQWAPEGFGEKIQSWLESERWLGLDGPPRSCSERQQGNDQISHERVQSSHQPERQTGQNAPPARTHVRHWRGDSAKDLSNIHVIMLYCRKLSVSC